MSSPAEHKTCKNGSDGNKKKRNRNSNRRKQRKLTDFEVQNLHEKFIAETIFYLKEKLRNESDALFQNGSQSGAFKSDNNSSCVMDGFNVKTNKKSGSKSKTSVEVPDVNEPSTSKCLVSLLQNLNVNDTRTQLDSFCGVVGNDYTHQNASHQQQLQQQRQSSKKVKKQCKTSDSPHSGPSKENPSDKICSNSEVSNQPTKIVNEGKKKKLKVAKTSKVPDSQDINCRTNVFTNSKLNPGERLAPVDQVPLKYSKTEIKSRERNHSYYDGGMELSSYMSEMEFDSFFEEEVFTGTIRINQKNFTQAYISSPDFGRDVLVNGLEDRNQALEGDEVYFALKGYDDFYSPSSITGEFRRTGIILAIKTKLHNRMAIGTVKVQSRPSESAVLSPRDKRIPQIRLRKRNWPVGYAENPRLFENRIFQVEITKWKDPSSPEGVITKEVGFVGNVESETSAIMLALDLDETPYSDYYNHCLPGLPYIISNRDMIGRMDFRKDRIFTIDPATAKDLDDAVSCKILPNGNYLIGVHISDVTNFIQDRTPLDEAAAERGTSVYLVQKTYPMLPSGLCELCALTPGEDKLTFSVLWEVTRDMKFLSCFFTRSVINSCGQFSYDQVQDILDDSEDVSLPTIHGGHDLLDIIVSIKLLHRIAVHLRNKRFKNGALRIDQTEIMFSLDENGLPSKYTVREQKDSNRLIEEFMLLANIAVAERLVTTYPRLAFLRSHAPPSEHMLDKIKTSLANYGVNLDISSSKTLQLSLSKYHGSDPASAAKMMVLNAMIAKPMARAKYYCADKFPYSEDRKHYALNVPYYTHFTSPIRRYADIMVHRLLAASLGYRTVPEWTTNFVQRMAEQCNKQKYAAKMAGERSTELFFYKYMLQKVPLVCKAVVYDVKRKSFDCILLDNGFHEKVYLENFEGSVTSAVTAKGEMKLIVKWPKTEGRSEKAEVIEMFSIVTILLQKSKQRGKLKATLLMSDSQNESGRPSR